MHLYATYPGHELYHTYLDLRYRILRQPLGLPRGAEIDEADARPSTRHLVWAEEGRALGCVQMQAMPEPGLARIRLMAVDPKAERLGIGKSLLSVIFDIAREEGYHTLSLFAREHAVPFYVACGFSLHEEVAPFHGIRHWRMTIHP